VEGGVTIPVVKNGLNNRFFFPYIVKGKLGLFGANSVLGARPTPHGAQKLLDAKRDEGYVDLKIIKVSEKI